MLPAYVALALLEAMRNIDTPVEDGLEEIAGEVVSKRLGLSETVAAQIQRYRDKADGGEMVSRDEVLAVVRLVGRRPDAPLVFADAGRRAARFAIRFDAGGGRAFARLPGTLGRSAGARAAKKVAERAFHADLDAATSAPRAVVNESLTVQGTSGSDACVFYGAAFGELLRGLMGFEGAMFHEKCRATGGDTCEWHGARMATEE